MQEASLLCLQVWISEGGPCVPVEGLLQEAVCALTPRALLARSGGAGAVYGQAGRSHW